ncbi:hypothetical protein OQ477_11650 [Bacillus sp. ChL18]|uniref:hypothetical protein n=1 Tax=Bacillus TaxID=1386 RepID=UPI002248CA52|nr:hypothetical protein [Bacillus sp. ChL18]MCX2810628.1 hypothetical protein [Bacillus sp. ChL18]
MGKADVKNVNWFVRILLIIFILYLLSIITAGFLMGTPTYNLTPENITLFVLITILILSESFDNLNMGKYLSLSREIKQKKEEVLEAKQENADLREHIIKMTMLINQNQHQTNNTINGVTPELLHMLGVIKADEDKVLESDNGASKLSDMTPTELPSSTTVTESEFNKRDFHKFTKKESIELYLKKHNIPEINIIREVQFTPAFQGLDPIMERKIVFDAYLKTDIKEFFFEVLLTISPITLYRVYVQLSKINYYSQAKHVKAQMILLIPEFPTEYERRQYFRPERIIEAFQPAISNDLIRIEIIQFRLEDIERWKKELNN